ncbi:A disintegrin and metalloproteinase with thrombospondin motifs [Plakobranchus ocellatus]|uniref:A disintegrin and metalloproteinase with thrombospondin motifs n=1 Tax=Plakobranchus ocellatus TaxID=259542 RepID=A0AAV4A8C8_9GAST|nr:A disintegrin and metalloproteinase with thrombospondin motifs [Plakobranchus ocellatus]
MTKFYRIVIVTCHPDIRIRSALLFILLSVANSMYLPPSNGPEEILFKNQDGIVQGKDIRALKWRRELVDKSTPAMVQITGDPKVSDRIKLKVTTPGFALLFDLQKVDPVNTHDTHIVTIETNPISGELTYTMDALEPEALAYTNTFFHNMDKGTIVSIKRQANGKYYVEGCLTHKLVIAPPESSRRHKRSTSHSKAHTVYPVDVTDDMDRDLGESEIFSLTHGNNLLNSVSTKDDKDLNEIKKFNALLDSKWVRHEQDQSLDEEQEADLEDDYLEVPSIFASEEAWKAHQSQAEAKSNTVYAKEEEEAVSSFLSFDKQNNFTQFRKRRAVTPNIKSSLKLVREQPEVAVDQRFRTAKQFFTNIKQIPKNASYYFPQHSDYFSVKKLPSEKPLSKQNDMDRHGTLGTFSKRFEWNPTIYNILKKDFLVELKAFMSHRKAPTNPNQDQSTKFKGRKIDRSNSRLKLRRKRQLATDSQDVPGVSSNSQPTENIYRENTNFLVEVAVVVDARIYREFNYDWKQLQIFLLHFWQSVNARFQAFVNPRVQLKLKSINKIMFESMQPFIERNRLSPMSERVSVTSVLEDFRSYVSAHLEKNTHMPDHDIAVLLTGEDLCKKKSDGKWSKNSRGIAFVRGACISSRRFSNQTYDVGVAEVGRSFRGVLTTTHEVGHLLGAVHDGEKSSSACPATFGHLMSQTWTKPYFYNRFSECSRKNFQEFMRNTWYSNCLLNVDKNHAQDYTPPNIWPGQMLPLHDQCLYYIGGKPCRNVPLESQCGRLCCEKWSRPFVSNEPAADGTTCGIDKMCFNGECLHKYALPPL